MGPSTGKAYEMYDGNKRCLKVPEMKIAMVNTTHQHEQ